MNHTPCNRCDLGLLASIWSFSWQQNYHTPIKSKDSQLVLRFCYLSVIYFNPYPLFFLDFPILFHFTYIIFSTALKSADFPSSRIPPPWFLSSRCMPFSEERGFTLPHSFWNELCSTPAWMLCIQEEANDLLEASIQSQWEQAFLLVPAPLCISHRNSFWKCVLLTQQEEQRKRPEGGELETSDWLTVATGITLSSSIDFLTAYTMKMVPWCDEKRGENDLWFFKNYNYHFVRECGAQWNREHRKSKRIRIEKW